MRIALAITHPTYSKRKNLAEILRYIKLAAKHNADFILFPEAAYTGLITNEKPQHDKQYFTLIPGKITKKIAKVAKETQIFVGIGLLELSKDKFYDSAILFNREGEIILKYQRITSGWHTNRADKKIYSEGSEIPTVETQFGIVAFLLCGDLFDEKLVKQVKEMKIDYLFLPLARSIEITFENIFAKWKKEMTEGYIPQIKKLRTTTFLVNYYSPKLIENNILPVGGAAAVSSKGEVLSSFPILQNGLLFIDLNDDPKNEVQKLFT